MYTANKKLFMVLPERAVFGDYGILFHLKSNIIFRTKDERNEFQDMTFS